MGVMNIVVGIMFLVGAFVMVYDSSVVDCRCERKCAEMQLKEDGSLINSRGMTISEGIGNLSVYDVVNNLSIKSVEQCSIERDERVDYERTRSKLYWVLSGVLIVVLIATIIIDVVTGERFKGTCR
jgi:adhesin HecA-like repeat protein